MDLTTTYLEPQVLHRCGGRTGLLRARPADQAGHERHDYRDGGDHGGHRYELVLDELIGRAEHRSASSYGISLGSTVELGQALGRLPRKLVVPAVSGREYGFGTGLTPEVTAAVEPLVQRLLDVLLGEQLPRACWYRSRRQGQGQRVEVSRLAA